MLMSYSRAVEGVHVSSLTHSPSGRPARQTILLRAGWPSHQPDWLVQQQWLFLAAMACVLIGAAKGSWSGVGSASNYNVRGQGCEHDLRSVELWHRAHATTKHYSTVCGAQSIWKHACKANISDVLVANKGKHVGAH